MAEYPMCIITKRKATNKDYYELVGIGHMSRGASALYTTGTKKHCIEQFYKRELQKVSELYILYEGELNGQEEKESEKEISKS
jgi:hypothetical protein